MKTSSMAGLVMAGGESSRMKTDKGLIKRDGITWSQHTYHKLAALDIPVYYSVQLQQISAYQEFSAAENLLTDLPDLPVKGPLRGLLSAHLQLPDQAIFLLACDMPDLPAELLRSLQLFYLNQVAPTTCCFRIGMEPEPMCAIFDPASLQKIYKLASQQLLPKFSMKFVLNLLQATTIEVPTESQTYFTNYNSPDDLLPKS